MKFHVLGLSHAPTRREYSADAFCQKVRLLCLMLTALGHEVIHYGVEGSEVACTEDVVVLDQETYKRTHDYDWHRESGFDLNQASEANLTFIANAVSEIRKRAKKNDFLLCPFGIGHKPIAEMFKDLIVVESGIGYEATFAQWRVFESYSWMHFHYGKEQRALSPSFYDAVIPNYLDMVDYPFEAEKEDYFIFLGRSSVLKGLNIVDEMCKQLGKRLLVAGQGGPPEGIECEYLGVLSIEDRAKYVSKAQAFCCPTYYIEPFGTVAIEAMAYGTPVIATDMGAFTETVLHGITGYRCRTLEQFVWAGAHINEIDPMMCRAWAQANFSLEKVSLMYEEYFQSLAVLFNEKSAGWYTKHPARTELDWLKRVYPHGVD